MLGDDKYVVRRPTGSHAWVVQGFTISVLLAIYLATHKTHLPSDSGYVFGVLYWLGRLSAEFLLFAGVVLLFEISTFAHRLGWPAYFALAALITLIPFLLLVTMYDLMVGLPEVSDILDQKFHGAHFFSSFLQEAGTVFANHIMYCVLVSVPRIFQFGTASPVAAEPAASEEPETPRKPVPADDGPSEPGFLSRVSPALSGRIQLVEAQEHYIRVRTSDGTGIALYRFGDAMRDLSGYPGLQVHRSFWVADAAIRSLSKGRNGLRLILLNGEEVPVSRRYEIEVKARYGGLAFL